MAARRWSRLLAVSALAASLTGGGLALAYSIERVALPGPVKSSLVALRDAMWLDRHRLSESVIQIADRRPIDARCARGWFQPQRQRRAPGSLVRLDDGFTLLAVPPHTLASGGGTLADRKVSPLVDLELAGCTRFLAQKLEADAQRQNVLHLRRELSTRTGAALWVLRVPIERTTLMLDLTPRSYRPVALSLLTQRLRAHSSLRFAPLSTAVLHNLLHNLPAENAERAGAREQAAFERLVRQQLPVYCGGSQKRLVALTFDDGPGPDSALALRILRRDRAAATFFLVGRNLRHTARLVRAERELGALGDHTWTHPLLPLLPKAAIAQQLRKTQQAVRRLSGAPVDLFRPPYGSTNRLIARDAANDGMLVVLWSIDSRDSQGAPWYRIASIVEQQTRPGSIILMHENHGQTIRALKFRILPWLHRHQLKPVTIPYLLAHDPPTEMQLRVGERGCIAPTLSFRPQSG
jgi:peptidoglycan/xylan/chitin deacetylase (PgdA/CDA1 family)